MTREQIDGDKLRKSIILDSDDIIYMLKNNILERLSMDELKECDRLIGQAWYILLKKYNPKI